ncbi:uncharacterized protein LOC135940234 [Cloeon dipterum]|uniref:uncharacterized protein LOC135940234 n=1 Tax=Cloeon dipterum TaxID=197152 RepID=UPI0032208B6E
MALLDSLLASQHNQEVRNERSSSEGITNSSEAASSASTADRIREIITPVAVSVLVRALPEWKIPPRHRLLAPGHQCCLCLSHYEAGETVSGLQCGHEFHADCLKPWLQRNSARSRGARCPIDHMDLTPWLTERLISRQRTASREPPPSKSVPAGANDDLSLRSSRLTLINRLHVGLHPHPCGHLPTPPPSTCSSPPPPPAPSSSGASRPTSGGRKGRLAAQHSAAVLHMVSLHLPIEAQEAAAGGGLVGGRTKQMEPRRGRLSWNSREPALHLEIPCRKISLKAKCQKLN